jgi:hypothetical protein
MKKSQMYSLGQVAREKVDCVNELRRLISTATTERPLQELLEKAPWLISAEWTPIVMDRPLKQFRNDFEAWYKNKYGTEVSTTAIDRPTKRPDFVFVSLPQNLEIVEIKKPRHAIDDKEFERAYGYFDAVQKFLEANPEIAKKFGDVQLTLVCESVDALSAPHRKLVANDPAIWHRPWETILNAAGAAYDDYLRALEDIKKVEASAEVSREGEGTSEANGLHEPDAAQEGDAE